MKAANKIEEFMREFYPGRTVVFNEDIDYRAYRIVDSVIENNIFESKVASVQLAYFNENDIKLRYINSDEDFDLNLFLRTVRAVNDDEFLNVPMDNIRDKLQEQEDAVFDELKMSLDR